MSSIPQVVSSGLCHCGCGLPAPIATRNRPQFGYKKGDTLRFRRGHLPRLTAETRFWAKVNRSGGPDACWLWTAYCLPTGHGEFAVDGRLVVSSRYSWELAHGPIPAGMNVCHNCPGGDNPACVNPAHLFLGTQAVNMHDCKTKGRTQHGEGHSFAKLTTAKVQEILERCANGEARKVIAAEFGISRATVGKLIRRESWQHV